MVTKEPYTFKVEEGVHRDVASLGSDPKAATVTDTIAASLQCQERDLNAPLPERSRLEERPEAGTTPPERADTLSKIKGRTDMGVRERLVVGYAPAQEPQ